MPTSNNVALVPLLLVIVCGCNRAVESGVEPDSGVDTDSDSDWDSDTETDCSEADYRQCGEDGHVHWFDSCDAQGPMAEECPDNAECVNTSPTEAECVCVNQWQGEGCEECPENWDPEQDCDECLPGWSGEACDQLCVRFVDADASEGGDGLSWSTALARVQDGIEAASDAVLADDAPSGCQVWVAEGTYYVYEASSSDTLLLDHGVSIFGGFSGDETDLDERDLEAHHTVLDAYDGPGQNARVHTVLEVVDDVRVDGFTITNGYGSYEEYSAGGMVVEGASAVIANCRFEDNEGGYAGGLVLDEAWAELDNCVFVENQGDLAGGLYIEDCSPTLSGCRFVSNWSAFWDPYHTWYGGAIVIDQGSPPIENCIFVQNELFEVVVLTGAPTISNCTFVNAFELDDSAFSLWKDASEPGEPVVRNSVFFGGGILVGHYEDLLTFAATGCDFSYSGDLDIAYSIVSGGCEGESVVAVYDVDPLFVDPENSDFRLQPESPCIDAADGTEAPELDIDGNPRVDDPGSVNTGIGPPWADMGAYEYQPG